ncbi:translation initiation factor eIF4E [Cichlidogyrus casuarinus]|uniref:Translation initiation factor eIF4E n=1 Tax=Cichlidogyrus casuarinus TaxID=1844966 RepID=A0ABD2Q8H7_9PLAT
MKIIFIIIFNSCNRWCYQIFQHKTSVDWDLCFTTVSCINTVESFWSVYLNVPSPSKVPNGTDLYLFKSHIQPKWEDPANQQGGKWILPVSKDNVDEVWREILLLIVGSGWDTDEEDEQICGIVFQPRARGLKIAVWTGKSKDSKTCISIGKKLKEVSKIEANVGYQDVDWQQKLERGMDEFKGIYNV